MELGSAWKRLEDLEANEVAGGKSSVQGAPSPAAIGLSSVRSLLVLTI